MTWVYVAGAPPVGTSLGLEPAAFTSCNRIRLVDEPGEENATVLPLVSFRLLMPLAVGAYQNASAAPVPSAEMMRTGAPLEYAPMTPRMPFDIATSMEPASSGVNVEAPPSVYNTSISRPASLKKPCFSAMSTMVLSQKPRCATATFSVSASAPDQI